MLRSMVRETEVRAADLILPLFVTEGEGVRTPVQSMPGVDNTSVDGIVADATEAFELGIPAVLLFGIPAEKDEEKPAEKEEKEEQLRKELDER